MRKYLMFMFVFFNSVAFSQLDSLSSKKKWAGEHELFAEVLGTGITGSIGYTFQLRNQKNLFSFTGGIGGRYFNHKHLNMFLFYLGLKYGYLIGSNKSLNIFYNYGRANNLYGVFKEESLTLEDYCYNNHISNSSCIDYFWYHNFGLSMQFRLNKKLRYELGLSTFKLNNLNKDRVLIWPSFKIKYRL